MGGNPRYGAWGASNWMGVARTVSAIRREGWPVHAVCLRCDLQMSVDLLRIERERGSDFVLWGRTGACRRWLCRGRAMFVVHPTKANGPVPML